MKIAVPTEGKIVAGHFGHCEGFTIFECEGTKIISRQFVPNPGHKPGFLPVFLHEKGVDTIIAGGIGGGAVDIFNERRVQVIAGATGEVETAVTSYLNGSLQSTGSICHEHEHQGECEG